MTLLTEANQIGQIVRLLVVVIFATDITEMPEGYNVVNVKGSLSFLLVHAAMTAFAAVALACGAGLAIPVGAIVIVWATFPIMVILARLVFGTPLGATLHAAKVVFIALESGYTSLPKTTTTLIAIDQQNAIPPGMIFPHVCFAYPCTATFVIAKMKHLTISMVFVALKLLSALSAFHQYRLTGLPCFKTWGAAKKVSGSTGFNMRRGFLDGLSALMASDNNGHTKNLLLVIDRLLVEGIRSRIGGRVNDSRSPASGQQMYAFDASYYSRLQEESQ